MINFSVVVVVVVFRLLVVTIYDRGLSTGEHYTVVLHMDCQEEDYAEGDPWDITVYDRILILPHESPIFFRSNYIQSSIAVRGWGEGIGHSPGGSGGGGQSP